jgi:hypothetical protein
MVHVTAGVVHVTNRVTLREFDATPLPAGRPVGSTIYPGMQFTAAGIFHALNYLGYDVSLNDVCVFIPAGFSCLACLFTVRAIKSRLQLPP